MWSNFIMCSNNKFVIAPHDKFTMYAASSWFTLFWPNWRTFVWSKNLPKNLSVEKTWEISCMHSCTIQRVASHMVITCNRNLDISYELMTSILVNRTSPSLPNKSTLVLYIPWHWPKTILTNGSYVVLSLCTKDSGRDLFFYKSRSSSQTLIQIELLLCVHFLALIIDIYRQPWQMDLLWLSLIHIWRCRRLLTCRSRWSPYH